MAEPRGEPFGFDSPLQIVVTRQVTRTVYPDRRVMDEHAMAYLPHGCLTGVHADRVVAFVQRLMAPPRTETAEVEEDRG